MKIKTQQCLKWYRGTGEKNNTDKMKRQIEITAIFYYKNITIIGTSESKNKVSGQEILFKTLIAVNIQI